MKAELPNFTAPFPNAMMIHIPRLNPALCAEFNLIQKSLHALDDISLPYWNNEARSLPVFLIHLKHSVMC